MKGVEKPESLLQGKEQQRARKFNVKWTKYSKWAPRIYCGRPKLAIKGPHGYQGFGLYLDPCLQC